MDCLLYSVRLSVFPVPLWFVGSAGARLDRAGQPQTCARIVGQRFALHRTRPSNDRPVVGLSIRGLEPGPETGTLPALVHTVDRHRAMDGATGQHRLRSGGNPTSYARQSPGRPGAPGQKLAARPA